MSELEKYLSKMLDDYEVEDALRYSRIDRDDIEIENAKLKQENERLKERLKEIGEDSKRDLRELERLKAENEHHEKMWQELKEMGNRLP